MSSQFRVTFLPDASSAWVDEGVNLLQAAAVANVAIDAPCGDRGICGKCKVQISGQTRQPTLQEKMLIPYDDLEAGWRLACQTMVDRDMEVEVPERALKPAVVPISQIEPKPAVHKQHIVLQEPTIEDPTSDLTRLRAGMPPERQDFDVELSVLHSLPLPLRESAYDVTAVTVGRSLVAVEPRNTTSRCYGLAVDLGTTSVVAMLTDLASGKVIGVESRLNGQANYGADVISRIHSTMDSGTVEPLQRAAVSTINSAMDTLLARYGVQREEVYEAVVVGNTCMNHLFLGVDPQSLSMAPYQPVVSEPVVSRAADLGLAIHPHGTVYTLPNVAGFVGSDTVAVILATGMHKSEDIKL
ncbi:MAG TPA: 2Fe-2S iron-sulfur cluster-binding protein, partial [Chloroflexota bacterium]